MGLEVLGRMLRTVDYDLLTTPEREELLDLVQELAEVYSQMRPCEIRALELAIKAQAASTAMTSEYLH